MAHSAAHHTPKATSTIWSDYQSVVSSAAKGTAHGLRAGNRFAAMVKSTLSDRGARFVQATCKVKAHQDASDLTGEDKRLAIGNGFADTFAKKGAKLFVSPSLDMLQDLAGKEKNAETVAL